jgi:hypothetical protein
MYPHPRDKDFYNKLYEKYEFTSNEITDENLENIVRRDSDYFRLMPYQKFVNNYLNENTPYNRLLVLASTGSGKSVTAVSTIESVRMNSPNKKIYIIGSNEVKDIFIDALLGEAGKYYRFTELIPPHIIDRLNFLKNIDSQEAQEEYYQIRMKDIVKSLANMGIIFYTYQKFRNIIENNPSFNINGDFLIIDEFHSYLNENTWAKTLSTLLDRSKDFKFLALTATILVDKPIQIVDAFNIILPKEVRLTVEDLFNEDNSLKADALDRIGMASRGYVSFVNARHPAQFPRVQEIGEIPKESFKDPETGRKYKIRYTKIVRCEMSDYQYSTYKKYFVGKVSMEAKKYFDIVFPNPLNEKYGQIEPLIAINAYEQNSKFTREHGINFDRESRSISGNFLHISKLKKYSNKFLKLFNNINKNIGPHFVYSRYVNITGTKLIGYMLDRNGFTNFEHTGAQNQDSVRCAICGIINSEHKKQPHKFSPATYVIYSADMNKFMRSRIETIYTSPENRDGSIIKVLLGSQLTKESLNLHRTRCVHIVNYQENFARVTQIVGRAERLGSLLDLPFDEQVIKVFKYTSSIPGKKALSGEEVEYAKDEENAVVIRKITDSLRAYSIDCQLNKKLNEIVIPGSGGILSEYKESRDDFCAYDLKGTKKGQDKSTYKVYFHQQEMKIVINFIKHLFAKKSIWDVKNIMREINLEITTQIIDKNFVYLALNHMIESQMVFYNRQDHSGYITYKNGENSSGYIIMQDVENHEETIQDRMFAEVNNITEYDLEYFIQERRLEHEQMINKSYELILQEIEEILEMEAASSALPLKIRIAKLLESQIKDKQISILESAIKDYYNCYLQNKRSPESVNLILRHYKYSLIDLEQLLDESDYSRIRNQVIGTIPFTKKIIEASFKVSPLKNIPFKIFIGHIYNGSPRCLSEDGKIWGSCNKFIKKRKSHIQEKENDYIVGFIEHDRLGKPVFKIIEKKGKKTTDKRREKRGVICKNINQKETITKIMKTLGIKGDEDSIKNSCLLIEDHLRNLQDKENKKGTGIIWFREFVDRFREH